MRVSLFFFFCCCCHRTLSHLPSCFYGYFKSSASFCCLWGFLAMVRMIELPVTRTSTVFVHAVVLAECCVPNKLDLTAHGNNSGGITSTTLTWCLIPCFFLWISVVVGFAASPSIINFSSFSLFSKSSFFSRSY